MEITRETIENIASLARLYLTEEEKERLARDMAQIINYMDKLKELDTDGIEPLSHVMLLKNVLRRDKTEPSYDKEKILANAPSVRNGYFVVPPIME